jgi:SagB-type dehydrogenase family enzyme
MRILTLALLVGMLAGCQQGRQRSTAQRAAPVAATSVAPAAGRPSVGSRDVYMETSMTRDTKDPEPGAATEPSSIRAYPGAERIALPRPQPKAKVTLAQALYLRMPGAGAVTLDRQLLSNVLHYGYGETGGSGGLRAAASAGALYPTDLFLSVRRANGLERGIYYYDPRSHGLVRVAAAEASSLTDPPFSLMLGASYRRSAFKYGARAPRYVALDVGHVAANLLLAGRALGVDCDANRRFEAEDRQRALGLAAKDEGLLMVLDCEVKREQPTPAATKPTSTLDRDLFEVITARRSYRQYLDQPVARNDLEELTTAVRTLHATAGVATSVFVRAVTGLSPGLYALDQANGTLGLVRPGDFSSELARAGLGQAMLAQAAYVVAWTMLDDRAFGQACLQAGIMGELGYLVATAQNLGVCGVGAYFDDEVGKLFGERPQRALYLLAVGQRR